MIENAINCIVIDVCIMDKGPSKELIYVYIGDHLKELEYYFGIIQFLDSKKKFKRIIKTVSYLKNKSEKVCRNLEKLVDKETLQLFRQSLDRHYNRFYVYFISKYKSISDFLFAKSDLLDKLDKADITQLYKELSYLRKFALMFDSERIEEITDLLKRVKGLFSYRKFLLCSKKRLLNFRNYIGDIHNKLNEYKGMEVKDINELNKILKVVNKRLPEYFAYKTDFNLEDQVEDILKEYMRSVGLVKNQISNLEFYYNEIWTKLYSDLCAKIGKGTLIRLVYYRQLRNLERMLVEVNKLKSNYNSCIDLLKDYFGIHDMENFEDLDVKQEIKQTLIDLVKPFEVGKRTISFKDSSLLNSFYKNFFGGKYKLIISDASTVNPFIISPNLVKLVDDIVSNNKRKIKRAEAIYRFIVRGISYKKTNGYKTAEEILKRKYGVCLDMAVLYVTMARLARLNSKVVFVDKDFRGKKVAHACAMVEVNDKKILVDPAYASFDIEHRKYKVVDDKEIIDYYKLVN